MVELTLKWEKFGLSQGLHDMMKRQELVDVTVMCEGQFIQAHKSVLAACSSQFRQIFKSAPDKSPVIVLRGVRKDHFKHLLRFMYLGEVTVSQDDIEEFIAVADDLGVSALSKKAKNNDLSERPPPDPPAEMLPAHKVDVPPAPATPSRPAFEHPIPVPISESERNETAFGMDCVEIEPRTIKQEIEEIVINELGNDWSDNSMVADNPQFDPMQPVIQSVQGAYVDTKSGILDDPGPSTSEGGVPWPEDPSPNLRRTSRPMKRRITDSPALSFNDSDNEDDPPQSDSSASQGLGGILEVENPRFEGMLEAENPNIASRNLQSQDTTPPSSLNQCSICSVMLNTIRLKVMHENSIHKFKGAKCNICNKVFKNFDSLSIHCFRYHTGRDVGLRHVCEICGSNFSLSVNLKSHIRNSHGDLAVPHECKICHQMCKNKNALLYHMKSHPNASDPKN